MRLSGNTILITGGASGIGLAFAERFLKSENNVIIVGRREEKLKEAKDKFPGIHTRVCDVSKEEQRIDLFEWVRSEFPELNVLVNNAGIQQRVNLKDAKKNWSDYQNEIRINVDGPIHLSLLFTPHLLDQSDPAIINVSSGLAITPGVWVPIYSATKAALHSFTVSLRHQLENTGISVIEVFPPAVNTDLGGVGLHTFGAPLEDFADSVFKDLSRGEIEIAYGDSKNRLDASRDEIKEATGKAWENFLKNNPEFLT
jgi:uncharacterized oxidoreductase